MDDKAPDLKQIAAEQVARVNSIGDFVDMMQSTKTASLSQLQAFGWNNRYNSLTLNRSLVSEMYQEHGVIQVIVDQPVDDAFRGGIQLKIPEFSDDDIKKLDHYINTNNIVQTYAQCCKYARLYGGAGVIINAGQNEREPFNIRRVKEWTPLEFYAADRWELSYTTDGMGVDQFRQNDLERPYNYYGHVLHKSNVIKINGKEAPSLLRGQFGGWGVSELERLVRSYNQYLKHQNVAYEMLDEAKLDIFKIEGFNSAMATPRGPQLTAQRIQYANMVKNYENALVIDKEDEYEQKSFSFAGLAEILREIRIGLACDCRFPVAKLFGLSASGFASGEDSIENYNCMIENEVRSKIKAGLIEMLEICCQKIFGYVPDNLDFDWIPLRIITNDEETAKKNAELDRILKLKAAGIASDETIASLINTAKIFQTDVSAAEFVEPELDEITPPEDDEGLPTQNYRSRHNSFRKNAEFKEEDHPRAKDGKFGKGSGDSASSGGSSKGTEKKPKGPLKITADEKKEATAFILSLDENKTVKVTTPLQHKIAERLVAAGQAEIVGKKNYGRIDEIKAVREKRDDTSTITKTGKPSKTGALTADTLDSPETKNTFNSIKEKNPEMAKAAHDWGMAYYTYARKVQQGKTLSKEDKAIGERIVKQFDEHWDKLPSYEGKIVRDISLDIGEAKSLFKTGEFFETDAYSSFTAADSYLTRRKIRLQVDKSTNGKYVAGLLPDPEEREVIVPKGMKYKIERVEERDEAPYIIVHLSEVKK